MTQVEPIRWLSIVGLGEEGVESLRADARAAVTGAALVVGGRRHLELAAGLITGKSLAWPSPLTAAIPTLLAMAPRPVCVLASGDPFNYGVGATLVKHVPIEQIRAFPALSAFSLVAARLGWALQETTMIGLNGRPLERVVPCLQPGARIIALSADETTPALLAALLAERGFGASRLTILERLGGERERIRSCPAAAFFFADIAPLNCLAIEIEDAPRARSQAIPLAAGRADERFEHDGQLTKSETRAVTLSALAPRRGELLWDIGLGAGSVAIEWMLCDPANRAIGVEKNTQRAARARRNALALGAPDLKIVVGEAPAALAALAAPDAIFIGGGASAAGVIPAAWAALNSGGRLVINAISLETEAVLLDARRIYGGDLIRIGLQRAEAVGGKTAWRPAMTVTQWRITKP